MKTKNEVILVDERDNEIGVLEKIEAHRLGKLHRAFSIFVFNSKGELLIQKRALAKYHSGGLWSNTCCSHPRPGEQLEVTARKRLKEEMGIECDLREIHKFIYNTEFGNGLVEYEYDHVLVGRSDDMPVVNSEEAEDWRWVDTRFLVADMKDNPDSYTYWFRISLDDVLAVVTLGN
ncbi:MAG: isopentenyl-diphosphate Delta-isomerase [Candidatus Wildermuthbacteria bacterium]|nr:isopentenyl-diphosphate Delta-isomerase [Candidatus Wildermuthbacteria bacterium]